MSGLAKQIVIGASMQPHRCVLIDFTKASFDVWNTRHRAVAYVSLPTSFRLCR